MRKYRKTIELLAEAIEILESDEPDQDRLRYLITRAYLRHCDNLKKQ